MNKKTGYNGNYCHFQEVIETQEKTIVDLLSAVREQHDQLNNQKIKIKTLEDKVDTSAGVCIFGSECNPMKSKQVFNMHLFKLQNKIHSLADKLRQPSRHS